MAVDLVVRFFYEHIYAEHYIQYYLSLGFDRIYILMSIDQEPYAITNEKVTIIPHSYFGNDVYHHLDKLLPASGNWTLFCDADEYLYLKDFPNIQTFLETIPTDVEQIYFQWGLIENFAHMQGTSDLFNCLSTNNMYSNSFIKSMVRLNTKNIGKVTPHCCLDISNNYLWNTYVLFHSNHAVDIDNYTSTYPFLIHFHTRSLQNIFIKGIITHLTDSKKNMYIIKLQKDISEKNLTNILRYQKFKLPFCHANEKIVPINIRLSGIIIDYNLENKQLETLCQKNNINYSDLVEIIKQLHTKYNAQFRKTT
jgi:hypothetical protein